MAGPKLPEHADPPNSLIVRQRAFSQPNVRQGFALYTIGPTVDNRTRKHRVCMIGHRPSAIIHAYGGYQERLSNPVRSRV